MCIMIKPCAFKTDVASISVVFIYDEFMEKIAFFADLLLYRSFCLRMMYMSIFLPTFFQDFSYQLFSPFPYSLVIHQSLELGMRNLAECKFTST